MQIDVSEDTIWLEKQKGGFIKVFNANKVSVMLSFQLCKTNKAQIDSQATLFEIEGDRGDSGKIFADFKYVNFFQLSPFFLVSVAYDYLAIFLWKPM